MAARSRLTQPLPPPPLPGVSGPSSGAGTLASPAGLQQRAPRRPVAQFRESHGLAGAEGERAEAGRGLLRGLVGRKGARGGCGPTARGR